jgi:hypothetical protein
MQLEPQGAGAGEAGGEQARVAVLVAEGLAVWPQLLRAWAMYRRWLEV